MSPLGALIGDSFSQAMTDFGIPWYDYASHALLGFLSGLAFLRTLGFYGTRRNLATAVVTSFIGIVISTLFFMIIYISEYQSSWFDRFRFQLATALVASMVALILLPILLIISNKIESRKAPAG